MSGRRRGTAVLEDDAAREDETNRLWLHHVHAVQHAFLRSWRGEPRPFELPARLRRLGGEPPLIDFIAWLWWGRPGAEWSSLR